MRKAIVLRTVAGIGVCTTLFACGSDSTTEPPVVAENTSKVTALLGEIGNGQAAGANSVSSGGGATPSSSSASENAAACVFDAATVRFNCPAHTQNGMTFTSYFQLLDAANLPQTAFNQTTTAGIRMVTDATGTMNQQMQTPNGPVSATIQQTQHNDIVLSGLLTNQREHNGTGTMTAVIALTGMPTANVSATTTFAHMVFPAPGSGQMYPISGTVTASITSVTGSTPSVTTNQVTTYNGTAIATTVITLPNGSTRTCTYDMSAPPGSSPPNCT